MHTCIYKYTYIYIHPRTAQSFARSSLPGPPPPRVRLARWAFSSGIGTSRPQSRARLHVEYAERGNEYGNLFIFSLLCKYVRLEYVRIHVIYRVHQAEYVIHILVVAPQEYVNPYSTRGTARRAAARPSLDSLRGKL